MSKLPEKFPEYSIMHKTLSKKIAELQKENQTEEIKSKIQKYKEELERIEKMFPDHFLRTSYS